MINDTASWEQEVKEAREIRALEQKKKEAREIRDKAKVQASKS